MAVPKRKTPRARTRSRRAASISAAPISAMTRPYPIQPRVSTMKLSAGQRTMPAPCNANSTPKAASTAPSVKSAVFICLPAAG